jgi:hypothetical protein
MTVLVKPLLSPVSIPVSHPLKVNATHQMITLCTVHDWPDVGSA